MLEILNCLQEQPGEKKKKKRSKVMDLLWAGMQPGPWLAERDQGAPHSRVQLFTQCPCRFCIWGESSIFPYLFPLIDINNQLNIIYCFSTLFLTRFLKNLWICEEGWISSESYRFFLSWGILHNKLISSYSVLPTS